jgi:hypothetical protein
MVAIKILNINTLDMGEKVRHSMGTVVKENFTRAALTSNDPKSSRDS